MQVLTRSYTTDPMSSHTRQQKHRTQDSNSSSQQHKSYHSSGFSTISKGPRSSDSTNLTTASTLWSPVSTTSSIVSTTSTIKGFGNVTASNNVINRVAEKEDSIFPYTQRLRNRLRAVEGFDKECEYTDEWNPESDLVSHLWQTFRRGYTLTLILAVMYPELMPDTELEQEAHAENATLYDKKSKKFVYQFINKTRDLLDKSQDDMPTLSVLYGEDTTGFVKFARIVSALLDLLDDQTGLNSTRFLDAETSNGPAGKRTKRQHVVDELVTSERTYVQHLELLLDLKKFAEMNSHITGDAIHKIFHNLGPLLDFQRRFLISIEQMNLKTEDEQDWGGLFNDFSGGFKIYEWYIANQKNCEEAAMLYYDRLKRAGGPEELQQILESQTHFTAFLLKPFQRLTKYPLLLKELAKCGNLDEEKMANLQGAEKGLTNVLLSVNSLVRNQENRQAFDELCEQIDDWKGHKRDEFGDLLYYGQFPVKKDLPKSAKQTDREFKLYLFERMLLFAKQVSAKKQKLLPGGKPPSIASSKGSTRSKLTLKGRVYLINLVDVKTTSKPDSHTLQVIWDSDDSRQKMTVRFPTEAEMNIWRGTILERRGVERGKYEAQQKEFEKQGRRKLGDDEFGYMQHQEVPLNPYRDDTSLGGSMIYPSRFSSKEDLNGMLSQQQSDNSLRSRSTTGDSGSTGQLSQRGPNNKYHGPPLNTTIHSSGPSPLDRNGASYFSPGAESPVSSRTSSSSGMMPFFPRQPTPNNGWTNEDHNRHTAPAGASRPLHNSTSNGYNPNDQRGMRAPGQSMPMHHASLSQTRLRSASSPDVHSQQQALARQAGANAPPVPIVPAHHLAGQQPGVNRSQNTTPVYANGHPSTYSLNHSPPSQSRQGSNVREHASQKSIGGYDPRASQQTDSSSGAFSPASRGINSWHVNAFKITVTIKSEGMRFVLVVNPNVTFDVLRDRIEAKLVRATNLSFQSGLKLQFRDDDDGDYVTMQNDDDVQTVFDQWREAHSRRDSTMGLGEIDLFVNKVSN